MSNSNGPKPVRRIELKAATESTAQNPAVDLGLEKSSQSSELPEKSTAENMRPNFEKENSTEPETIKVELPGSSATAKRKSDALFDGKSAPRMVRSGDDSASSLILGIEREARQAETEAELRFLMVNSTRKIVNYRQGFLLSKKRPKKLCGRRDIQPVCR